MKSIPRKNSFEKYRRKDNKTISSLDFNKQKYFCEFTIDGRNTEFETKLKMIWLLFANFDEQSKADMLQF